MDSEDVINGFINKYRILHKDKEPSEHAYQQLDDAVCRMEARHFTDSPSNVAIESLTYLFELVDDSSDQSLVQNSLLLLHNIFSKRCYGFFVKPKYILHFTASLASSVSVNYEEYDENELEKRLQILQYLTYGIKVSIVDDYLKGFIDFLIAKIKAGCSRQSTLKSFLMILQNLINKSSVVKTCIRNGTDPSAFYISLLQLMNDCADSLVRILAMFIYTTLDSKGRKMVSSSNVNHIFELIFGIVIQNNEDAITYAVDLLEDLLLREDFLKQFLKFKYLKAYIQKVVGHLPKLTDHGSVSKVYELLLTLCSIDSLRPTVLAITFDSQNFNSDQPSPLTLASNWFYHELKHTETSTSYSAVFLTNLLKEANNFISLSDYSFDGEHIDLLSKEIGIQLSKCNKRSYTISPESCQRVIIILEVMTSLCEHVAYMEKISKSFDLTSVLSSVFEVHLRTCEADNLNSLITDDYMCDVVDVIIRLLMFMYNVKDQVDNLQEVFYLYLQDCRLMQILAKALSMNSKSRIQNTMLLVNIGMKLPNFPQIRLWEAMAKLNSTKHNLDASIDTVPPKSTVENRLSIPTVNHDIEQSVDQLIAHFKKDLQLKNLKPSQLMDVYENKIQMLELKCSNFEQLLDAKSKTLQQAENIIAQYRFRWAQDEGLENLHLRNIIHEVEKRNEALTEETTAVKINLASIHKKFDDLLHDMETVNREREKFQKANAAMNAVCNKLDEQVTKLGAENTALESRNSALESKEAASKVQIEELTKAINILGEEKRALKMEHKDVVGKYNHVKEMYYELETKNESSEGENNRLSAISKEQAAEIHSLKKELTKSNEDLKITTAKLEEKNKEFNSLQELLTNVSKMIHEK